MAARRKNLKSQKSGRQSVPLVPFCRIPKPLTSPFSTNFQIRAFLADLRLLAASNTTAVWPCPIGFTTGTERLSWVAQFPYLAEYSYVDECFREQGPGPLWMGMFITPIETVAECGMLCRCPSSGNCLGERAQHSQNYGARRMTTTLSAADNA
ncbi:hypothetical protein B0H14DRAFT_3132335 [Mycena olivaceomarginata]|nr:hypothetical protein B0H14DRAFT_3132335 [Mycena olivaceomarginata]